MTCNLFGNKGTSATCFNFCCQKLCMDKVDFLTGKITLLYNLKLQYYHYYFNEYNFLFSNLLLLLLFLISNRV